VLQDQDLVQMLLDGLLVVAVVEETLEMTEQEEEQVHQELLLHMLVLVMDPLEILLIVNLLILYSTRYLEQDLVVEVVDGLSQVLKTEEMVDLVLLL
jgi:hypothetical protein